MIKSDVPASEALILVLISFFSLLILLIDYLVPLGLAIGLLHTLPTIFSCVVFKRVSTVKWLIAFSIGLIIIGFFISPKSPLESFAIANRVLCIFSVVVTGVVGINLLSLIEKTRNLDNMARTALEASPNAMIMVDAEGTITLSNRKTEEIFGYSEGELLGQKIDCLVPSEIKGKHPSLRQGFFRNPSPRGMGTGRDLFGKRKDGSTVPVEIGLTPIETPSGLCVVSSIVDITERKKAEKDLAITMGKLIASNEMARTALEASPNAMIMVDVEGTITLSNRKTEEIFGYSKDELLGQKVDCLVPSEIKEKHPSLRQGFFRNPSPRGMGTGRDLFGKRKDGSTVPVEIGLTPIETPSGLCVVSSIVDITERKKAEKDLEITMKKLIASNEELERFAYITSHDLKTPLRGIGDLTEYLEEDLEEYFESKSANADVKKNIDRIHQQVERMNNLISGILHYSSVNAKAEDQKSVNVAEMVEQVFLDLDLEENQIQIEGELPTLMTNQTQLEQIFSNLMSNAKKYHHNLDELVISISSEDHGDFYSFSVGDNGPGIDPKFHKKIFEVFQTLQPKDELESTGIGLSIVKKIVASHGGRIDVFSSEGKGTKFTFLWPKVMIEPSTPDEKERPSFEKAV